MVASSLLISYLAAVFTKAADIPAVAFSSVIPEKILATAKQLSSHAGSYPHITNFNDPTQWVWEKADWWTSGFFPATLYALNDRASLCKSSEGLDIANWLAEGQSASSALIPLTNGNSQGHDQGFLSFPFADEYALHPDNKTATDNIVKFANILANRFVPAVGCTRSWDGNAANVTVIIDNMINLELLFLAANITGNTTYSDIAVSHATKTKDNHIREDGSTWHVIEYDAKTGKAVGKHTAQGYSDSSTWARGQSWGIYGFANVYKRTGKTEFLETARSLANYFLDNLPSTGIVPWDFNAPTSAYRPKDTSAAMVATNGLLLLAEQESDASLAKYWTDSAITVFNATAAFAWKGDNSWATLLSNGTVNKPQNNYDTGIVYGDYYYIVAGNELVSRGLASC